MFFFIVHLLIQYRKVSIFLTGIAMLFISCIAYYPKRQISDFEAFTRNDIPLSQKPSIYINLLFNEAMKCPTYEPDCANPSLENTLKKIVLDSELFNYHTFESDHTKPLDYELQIKIEYKIGGNISQIFIPLQIFSLGLIPIWGENELGVTANLFNTNGELVEIFSYNNAIITAVGVMFIPSARTNKEEDVYYFVLKNMLHQLFIDLAHNIIIDSR